MGKKWKKYFLLKIMNYLAHILRLRLTNARERKMGDKIPLRMDHDINFQMFIKDTRYHQAIFRTFAKSDEEALELWGTSQKTRAEGLGLIAALLVTIAFAALTIGTGDFRDDYDPSNLGDILVQLTYLIAMALAVCMGLVGALSCVFEVIAAHRVPTPIARRYAARTGCFNSITLVTVCIYALLVGAAAGVYLFFGPWQALVCLGMFIFGLVPMLILSWRYHMKGSIDFLCDIYNEHRAAGTLITLKED
jgi:MFS family permease